MIGKVFMQQYIYYVINILPLKETYIGRYIDTTWLEH